MKKLAIAALLLIGFLAPVASVVAQESGQGLEISPPLVDQKVDPGQSVKIDIRIRNITEDTLIAKGVINDFEAQGEEGLPKIITDEDAEPSPYSFQDWVEKVPDITLKPKELKKATIVIDVPKDATPGGHYGVVRFTAVPVEFEDNGVSLSASIGTLVLLNVSGDAEVGAETEEFFVSQNNKKGSFFEYGPITFTERIKNTGNVHFQPVGTVTLTDTFGKEVAELKVNEKEGNILPESIRRFEQRYEEKNLFGRYTAELDLTYADGQKLNETIIFWVLPYKIILAGLTLLIVIILFIVLAMKRFKKHVVEEVHHEEEMHEKHEKHEEHEAEAQEAVKDEDKEEEIKPPTPLTPIAPPKPQEPEQPEAEEEIPTEPKKISILDQNSEESSDDSAEEAK